ncbi:MAG: prephenate dehydratase [Cirrosporium novae-zelandiae]|nr:MAG: prephenate dehydratase [Cirrosporium novae-zelandiae]
MSSQNNHSQLVAYLGPPSSYSHQATLSYFSHLSPTSITPVPTITSIFHHVHTRAVTYGVVPFENSTHGSVVQTLDLFADREGSFPDLFVCGEVYLPVRHCLLVHKSSRIRTEEKDDKATDISLLKIKTIYSHPQALGQCQRYIHKHISPSVSLQDVSSTSRAAEIVSQDPSGTTAAIASSLSAQAHGLSILAEGIEDRPDNATRFLIIQKATGDDSDGVEETSSNSIPPPKCKTLISFTIPHTLPGALSDALSVFKAHSLNLTSINSRPSRDRPWHYVFFVEVEGRKGSERGNVVGRALDELSRVTRERRWLGTWRDALSGKSKREGEE